MEVKFTYLMREKTRFNGFKDSGLQAVNVIHETLSLNQNFSGIPEK